MSSPEDIPYPIQHKHDVTHILAIFSGLIGYSSDDTNKFLWMVGIAHGVRPEEIQESDYFTPQGEYRVDELASKAMKESLMSYYRYADLFGGQQRQDRVRGQSFLKVGRSLDYLEEAFTSES